jgi:hypothetical protein
MRSAAPVVVTVISLWLAHPAAQGGGTREFTVTGCLLSNGYAAFQVEDAVLDAIDGKAATAEERSAAPKKWLLDGGGNLRRQTGQKVKVVGRSSWRAGSAEESPGTPHLEATTVATVADSCQ